MIFSKLIALARPSFLTQVLGETPSLNLTMYCPEVAPGKVSTGSKPLGAARIGAARTARVAKVAAKKRMVSKVGTARAEDLGIEHSRKCKEFLK